MVITDKLRTARERSRLDALRSYDVLDTPSEEVFDECARLAASIAGTPIAMVTMVDDNRQWFKARVGLEATETPREFAFCAHTITGSDVFVVPDATQDDRFSANPMVVGGPHIRFYAGAPLVTATGAVIGTVCVIDSVPRELSLEQHQSLKLLSHHVMAQLDLRKRLLDFNRAGKKRAKTLAALRRAVDADEFVLLYQPKVDLGTNRIVGVEALLRWENPILGVISPTNFVPLLEQSGLIVKVGNWVIHRAASDYQDWVRRGLNAPRIAVNVSPVQLRDDGFVSGMKSALGGGASFDAGVDIEITEGVLIESVDDSIEKLRAIRELGVHIAIDDFGTGYSSLKYLAQLPITSLKIDRSFVGAMGDSARHLAIVSSIITLAHGLEISVVAEGVENDQQRELLKLRRCDEMQGYLHSRPMTKKKLEGMLRQEARRRLG